MPILWIISLHKYNQKWRERVHRISFSGAAIAYFGLFYFYDFFFSTFHTVITYFTGSFEYTLKHTHTDYKMAEKMTKITPIVDDNNNVHLDPLEACCMSSDDDDENVNEGDKKPESDSEEEEEEEEETKDAKAGTVDRRFKSLSISKQVLKGKKIKPKVVRKELLNRGDMDSGKFQALVDAKIAHAKGRYTGGRDHLLSMGLDEKYIVYIDRNGPIRGEVTAYSTNGNFFYSLEDAIKCQDDMSDASAIDPDCDFLTETFTVDGRNFVLMKKLLKMGLEQDPVAWKAHKKKFREMMIEDREKAKSQESLPHQVVSE